MSDEQVAPTLQTGVYAIRNALSGKRYIGSASRSFRRRWWEHRKLLRLGLHHSPHLQRAWEKYGAETFVFEEVECCAPEDCVSREQYWLDFYRAAEKEFGYNICPTAGSPLGRTLPPEHRQNIAAALRGRMLSNDHKARMSAARLGCRHTPEVCEKIAAKKRGVKLSAEHRAKIGARSRGRLHTPEAREAIAASKRGKPRSNECKAKLSASHTGLRKAWLDKVTPEMAAAIRRRYKPRDKADSARALARELGICRTAVLNVVHGRQSKYSLHLPATPAI